ncbi:DNA polymerase III subunit delta [Desulfocurvus sp. DL9XJH121]
MSDRPGFSFLLCPDPELVRLELESLVRRHGQGRDFDRRVHWADEDLSDAFWQDLTIPDLMGTPRLVVVRRANALLKEGWDKLTSALSSFNAQIWPVFCLESGPDKKGQMKPPAVLAKQKYWPVAEKRGWVWTSPGLTPATMGRFIKDFAARHELAIPPATARALADALPQDAVGAGNELHKILLAGGETREVKPEHVALVSHQADMDVFAFIASILDGRSPEKVWKKVFDNRLAPSTDSIFFAFLALITREARTLWELAQGEAPSAWVRRSDLDDKTRLAKRLGPTRLARIWDLVLEAEFGVKTGQRTPEQAFEAVVGGLFSLLKA